MYSCLTASHHSDLSMGFYCDSSALRSECIAALGSVLSGPIRLLVELLLSMLACRGRRDHRDAGSSSFKMKVCLC